MKKRMTLNLNTRTVEVLRNISARKGVSMSTMINELVEDMEKIEKIKEDDFAWLKEMGTWLNGKVTQKDLEDDPRLAHAWGYKPKKR